MIKRLKAQGEIGTFRVSEIQIYKQKSKQNTYKYKERNGNPGEDRCKYKEINGNPGEECQSTFVTR